MTDRIAKIRAFVDRGGWSAAMGDGMFDDIVYLLDELDQARTAAGCRACPSGCRECAGTDCECYEHQDLHPEHLAAEVERLRIKLDTETRLHNATANRLDDMEAARVRWAATAQEQLAAAKAELKHERSLSRRLATDHTTAVTALVTAEATIARVRAMPYRPRRTDNDWVSGHDTGYNNAIDDVRRALDATTAKESL